MSFDCKDKVILITGASSGIGRGVALHFGSEGAKVALVARNIEALRKVKAQILEEGGLAETFPFDLTRISDFPVLIDSIEGHFGETVALLVNNAGMGVIGMVDDVPIEGFSSNLEINFFAPVALTKAVIPGMKKKGYGQIINISSGCGWRGLPGAAAYSSSKFALNGFTESLRVELAPYGIQVLLFSPGRVVGTDIEKRSTLYGKVKKSIEGPSISIEMVAKKIFNASRKSKRTTILSFRAKIAFHLNYWFPGLLDFFLIQSESLPARNDLDEE